MRGVNATFKALIIGLPTKQQKADKCWLGKSRQRPFSSIEWRSFATKYLKVATRPILWGYAVPLVFMYPLFTVIYPYPRVDTQPRYSGGGGVPVMCNLKNVLAYLCSNLKWISTAVGVHSCTRVINVNFWKSWDNQPGDFLARVSFHKRMNSMTKCVIDPGNVSLLTWENNWRLSQKYCSYYQSIKVPVCLDSLNYY